MAQRGSRTARVPGHPGKLNSAQREALAAMVESGPMPAIHGVVRWRLKDLAMWVSEEFRHGGRLKVTAPKSVSTSFPGAQAPGGDSASVSQVLYAEASLAQARYDAVVCIAVRFQMKNLGRTCSRHSEIRTPY